MATISPTRPVSFEVFADEEPEMEEQARHIAAWGKNVFVKESRSCAPTEHNLRSYPVPFWRWNSVERDCAAHALGQVQQAVCDVLSDSAPAYVSVFAGRIADTGRDPVPLMREAVRHMVNDASAQLMWASPRELLNVFQADEIEIVT